MRLFGWETAFGNGSSGSGPDSLESEGGVDANMELTPERKEAISQGMGLRTYTSEHSVCEDWELAMLSSALSVHPVYLSLTPATQTPRLCYALVNPLYTYCCLAHAMQPQH
ncbi:hypothetical protein E2C01_038881 [Portunus trituberculatus]|uniref:Uncharacterized protein n=1 Tax=Portunus trituberculatus TaxID=210409 RepID=A0A5B7FDB3_PORTR|nr:hypothetical protein [Portunus trituberculatus]